jgi:hypothetical protein
VVGCGKKGVFKIILKIQNTANQPGQFSLSGLIFLHWAHGGAHGISKYFFLDHFSPSFLCQKWSFQELRF